MQSSTAVSHCAKDFCSFPRAGAAICKVFQESKLHKVHLYTLHTLFQAKRVYTFSCSALSTPVGNSSIKLQEKMIVTVLSSTLLLPSKKSQLSRHSPARQLEFAPTGSLQLFSLSPALLKALQSHKALWSSLAMTLNSDHTQRNNI